MADLTASREGTEKMKKGQGCIRYSGSKMIKETGFPGELGEKTWKKTIAARVQMET